MTAGTGSLWIEQAILKWADRREQEQGQIVEHLERELEQTQDAAHRKRIENHIAAATRRIARRKTIRAFFGRAEVPMPDKLRIAFFGMMVGGAAFLTSGMAIYLATAQLQYTRMAKLQDRIIQARGPVQTTSAQYAAFQPSP